MVPQAANTQKAVSDFFQNKRNILIYMLLKYLYNNYTVQAVAVLCPLQGLPKRKRGNSYKLLEANINTEHKEDIQLFYKNIHSSCKPKELGLPVW